MVNVTPRRATGYTVISAFKLGWRQKEAGMTCSGNGSSYLSLMLLHALQRGHMCSRSRRARACTVHVDGVTARLEHPHRPVRAVFAHGLPAVLAPVHLRAQRIHGE